MDRAGGGSGNISAKAGGALAVANAVSEVIQQGAQVASNMIRMTGTIDVAMIRGDVWGKAEASIQRTAYALEKIPVIGGAISGLYEAANAEYRATVSRIQATEARGREIAAYSPQLAQAVVQADVRKLHFDIEEAQRIGPQYAAMIDAKSRYEREAMRRDLDQKRQQFEDDLEELRWMEENEKLPWYERRVKSIRDIGVWLDEQFGTTRQGMVDEFRSIRRLIEQINENWQAMNGNAMMEEFYGLLGGQQPQVQPVPGGGQSDLNMDILRRLQGL